MIRKWRVSMIALMMLVLFGFGSQNQAMAQVSDDGLVCPGSIATDGWLETDVNYPEPIPADFSAALMGTVENRPLFERIGGLDWQHNDRLFTFGGFTDVGEGVESHTLNFFGVNIFPTNWPGTQLVGWWSQKEGRNTAFQITNPWVDFVSIHVHIFDESCQEIRDFCDFYSPYDTHVYDFGNLEDNPDFDIPDPNPSGRNLQGKEGFVTFTAVDFCEDERGDFVIPYNQLVGNMYMATGSTVVGVPEYEYGANLYSRRAFCEFDHEMSGGLVSEEGKRCFKNAEEEPVFLDGITGFLEPVQPTEFEGQFNTVNDATDPLDPEVIAGADVVYINFRDDYFAGQGGSFGYQPRKGTVIISPDIWGVTEDFESCGDLEICFARFGIDDPIVLSDGLPIPTPPTTSVTPTTPPSVTPTTPPPTTGGGGGGGGGGSCAIAGNPIQLGTAFANVLIPLLPVAFVFGLRVLRRRTMK